MRVHAMGINTRHENTFLIDRPDGLGDYLFLIFKTEAVVWLQGEPLRVHPGGFILYPIWIKQKYGAAGDVPEYRNHYIHFACEESVFFDEIRMWTNQVGYLQNLEEIEAILRLVSREQISVSEYHGENENLLLQLLFRKVAENQCREQNPSRDYKHLELLTGIRSEMYSTPDKYGSIRELAEAVHLSLSHFQALYKDYFGLSCYEDLLNARMSRGKEFLQNSNLSVREIANLCGYESDTCFMRCFKKREGVTPTEYRKR